MIGRGLGVALVGATGLAAALIGVEWTGVAFSRQAAKPPPAAHVRAPEAAAQAPSTGEGVKVSFADLPDAIVIHRGKLLTLPGAKSLWKYAERPSDGLAAAMYQDAKERMVIVTINGRGKVVGKLYPREPKFAAPEPFLVGVTERKGVVLGRVGRSFNARIAGRKRKLWLIDLESSGRYGICEGNPIEEGEAENYYVWDVRRAKPLLDLYDVGAMREFVDQPLSVHIVTTTRGCVVIHCASGLAIPRAVFLPSKAHRVPVDSVLENRTGRTVFATNCVAEGPGRLRGITRPEGKSYIVLFTGRIEGRKLRMTRAERVPLSSVPAGPSSGSRSR